MRRVHSRDDRFLFSDFCGITFKRNEQSIADTRITMKIVRGEKKLLCKKKEKED